MTNLYAVRDVKSSYWQPFCQANDATAIREFGLLVQSPKVVDIANDLQLWRLGTYDELTGVIVSACEYVCANYDVVKAASNIVEFPVKKEDVNECE